MANIIRCKLPDGIHRLKPFTVEDYRDLILVRADLDNHQEAEQTQILEELLEEYFPDLPKVWREYAFLLTFTSSIGNSVIQFVIECPKCGKRHPAVLNLRLAPLQNPSVKVSNVTANFDFPEISYDSDVDLILNNIKSLSDEEGIEYPWKDLDSESRNDFVDAIDKEKLETILRKLKPFSFSRNFSCCDIKHVLKYDSLLKIFKFLLGKDDAYAFYQINNLMVKHDYNYSAILNMLPLERSFALSIIEKDIKNDAKTRVP